jgi:hypothetical protein
MCGESQATGTEAKPIARINSCNFLDYLIGKKETKDGLLRGDLDDFDKRIVLPVKVCQAMEAMHKQQRQGLITGPNFEKEKKVLAAELDKLSPDLGKEFLEVSPEIGSIEQVRIVYVDVQRGEIGATPSSYGYGTEANILEPIQETLANYRIPVIGIHTHHGDSLFSPFDYYNLSYEIKS